MGNPNSDLFIKTISWLFVAPASDKGAKGHPNIITSSIGSSVSVFVVLLHCRVSDYTQCNFCKLSLIASLMMYMIILSLLPWAPVVCPTFLFFNISAPPHSSPLPTASIMSSSTCSNSQPKYLVVLVGNCHVQTPSRCEPEQACV